MDSRPSPISLYLCAPEQVLLESWSRSLKSGFSLLVYRDSRRTAPLPITLTLVAPGQCRKVSIRLSPERLAELDARRAEVGLSRSDYLRLLLQWGDRRHAEPTRAKSTGGIGCTAGNVSIPAATPAASSVHPTLHPPASNATPTRTPAVGCTAANVSIPTNPQPVPNLRAALQPGLHPSGSSMAGRADAVERERAARAAQRQRDDDADEAEVTRLCAIYDARVAAQASAARVAAASRPTSPGSPADPIRRTVVPAAPAPDPIPLPRPTPSHVPAPAIARMPVHNRVAPVAVSVNNPTSKKVNVMDMSENAHESAEKLPPNTAGTPRIAARGELDNTRKTMAEQGVENMRPVTLAYNVLDEDAMAEIGAAWREIRRGGTLRVILGLSTSAGIPLWPMDQDTADANVNACTTLIDDAGVRDGIRNHVTSTVFAVPMSETGSRLDGYGIEQVVDDIDEDADEDDEDLDLAEENDNDAAATADEEEESGLIVALNFQRKT